VDYFQQTLSMLSHLQRKAHNWIQDYRGLTQKNFDAMQPVYSSAKQDSASNRAPNWEGLGKVRSNVVESQQLGTSSPQQHDSST
jgi:hypothetical protein